MLAILVDGSADENGRHHFPKGGSGRTTLASHLAVAVVRAGHGPAVVIDTDQQQTLATWWNAREAETSKLAPVSLRELPEKLDALVATGAPSARTFADRDS
jgi:chromosome partitioning protein